MSVYFRSHGVAGRTDSPSTELYIKVQFGSEGRGAGARASPPGSRRGLELSSGGQRAEGKKSVYTLLRCR